MRQREEEEGRMAEPADRLAAEQRRRRSLTLLHHFHGRLRKNLNLLLETIGTFHRRSEVARRESATVIFLPEYTPYGGADVVLSFSLRDRKAFLWNQRFATFHDLRALTTLRHREQRQRLLINACGCRPRISTPCESSHVFSECIPPPSLRLPTTYGHHQPPQYDNY